MDGIIHFLTSCFLPEHRPIDEKKWVVVRSRLFCLLYDTMYYKGVDDIWRQIVRQFKINVFLRKAHNSIVGGNLLEIQLPAKYGRAAFRGWQHRRMWCRSVSNVTYAREWTSQWNKPRSLTNQFFRSNPSRSGNLIFWDPSNQSWLEPVINISSSQPTTTPNESKLKLSKTTQLHPRPNSYTNTFGEHTIVPSN